MREYRKRLRQKGLVRVEVHAPSADAVLIRQVARALRTEPQCAALARARLREALLPEAAGGLKALLASAPIEGLDLTRPYEPMRDVNL